MDREGTLRAWHASFVDAATDGAAGTLEPNAVFEKGSQLLQPVPSDRGGYVIVNSTNRSRELAMLVRRLQRMDVKVYQLTSSPTPRRSIRTATTRQRTFLVGSYWIPLAQGQKNWIQSMLSEDTWIPTDIIYDVSAWSNPLLMNLDGGWTGQGSPSATLVLPVTSVPEPALPWTCLRSVSSR